MTLLEILLLLIITYGLLASARRKQSAQPQAKRTPPSKQDQALEEALREIRETESHITNQLYNELEGALREIREALGIRWPASEQQQTPQPEEAEPMFRSLEQQAGPEFRSLEGTPKPFSQPRVAPHVHPPALDQPLRIETDHRAAPARQARLWLQCLRHRKGVQEAMVLTELLGPPRARRPWQPRLGSHGR